VTGSARGWLVAAAATCLVPFAVLLVLVQANWAPLRRADLSASKDRHDYARTHHGFVEAMQVVSAIGSGWALTGVFVAVAAWLLWRRQFLVLFIPRVSRSARPVLVLAGAVWVAVVGFSRIALGVHYVSDVLAGFALGTAWLALMVAAFDAWTHRHPATPPSP
jgi:PAP2 superfamily